MFDLGWGELLIIGIVALIVVGPKDLPGMFHTLGRFTGKLRRMAREFQRAMEDAAKETGVKEATDSLKGVTSPSKMGLDKLNQAAEKFEKWDPTKATEKKAKKEPGPETKKLSEERAAAAKKIHEHSAKKAEARIAAEKAAASEAEAAEQEKAETPKPPAADAGDKSA